MVPIRETFGNTDALSLFHYTNAPDRKHFICRLLFGAVSICEKLNAAQKSVSFFGLSAHAHRK
jgi:hypothetical protein